MDADDQESECSELSLSCGSSSFYDDEVTESLEDENGDFEETHGQNIGINPYQFEPYMSNSETEPEDDENNDHDDNRLYNSSWCSCQQCDVMPTARECICCKEIQRVQDVASDVPNIQCITQHPGFPTICLDRYVLDVAYLQYRQQYGERPEQNNERKRYTAYRQFVRWCWHYLGKDVRVVLPSCVVMKIRRTFPDPHADYIGFQTSTD